MPKRTAPLESFKNSLCWSLTADIESQMPFREWQLQEREFCCRAPTHELGPTEKIPMLLNLLVDWDWDDLHVMRVHFSLEFIRLERDEWDNLQALYRATC